MSKSDICMLDCSTIDCNTNDCKRLKDYEKGFNDALSNAGVVLYIDKIKREAREEHGLITIKDSESIRLKQLNIAKEYLISAIKNYDYESYDDSYMMISQENIIKIIENVFESII